MPYLGTQPNNIVKNSGLYTPSEILQLEKDGHWGGSLELIEEQTFSTSSAVEFTDIKENIYDVHLLQFTGIEGSTSINGGLRFYESGVLETASVYQDASTFGTSGGLFLDIKSTARDNIYFHNYGTEQKTGGYAYIYNAGNSSKYTFTTYQSNQAFNSSMTFYFGGGVLPQASIVDGIRLYASTGTLTGTAKLYGVKQ